MLNETAPASVEKKLRVLIADDSLLVRTSLAVSCSVLPQVDLVGEARDGLETIELVRELKPDVLTLDMLMPNMTGIDVLRQMRQERIDCVVIILTSVAEEYYLDEFVKLGAKYFYDKGKEMEKVSELLKTLSHS